MFLLYVSRDAPLLGTIQGHQQSQRQDPNKETDDRDPTSLPSETGSSVSVGSSKSLTSMSPCSLEEMDNVAGITKILCLTVELDTGINDDSDA